MWVKWQPEHTDMCAFYSITHVHTHKRKHTNTHTHTHTLTHTYMYTFYTHTHSHTLSDSHTDTHLHTHTHTHTHTHSLSLSLTHDKPTKSTWANVVAMSHVVAKGRDCVQNQFLIWLDRLRNFISILFNLDTHALASKRNQLLLPRLKYNKFLLHFEQRITLNRLNWMTNWYHLA